MVVALLATRHESNFTCGGNGNPHCLAYFAPYSMQVGSNILVFSYILLILTLTTHYLLLLYYVKYLI